MSNRIELVGNRKAAVARAVRAAISASVSVLDGAGMIQIPDAKKRWTLAEGDANLLLDKLPPHSIDVAITSPPYWSVRRYAGGDGLGNEVAPEQYIEHLVRILTKLRRVLREDGSLWLNMGDTYVNKSLCGIPWRTALALRDLGWTIRNAVVWDKVKGNPCNSKDKLRDMYEIVFHLAVGKSIFYDADAIREPPKPPSIRAGRVTTATGVSGVKYRQQIAHSGLTPSEKREAVTALDTILRRVGAGEIPDFRMIIRGVQRSTHGADTDFSGRASELQNRGFCILTYHPNGSKPGDIWRIIPEDEWRTDSHAAVYPTALCRIPILATCPPGGVVLDPFVGTGTTIVAALALGRRAIGIDVSAEYLSVADARLRSLSGQQGLAFSG